MSQPTVSEEEIWAALDTVKDPEIPVISVVDMGIVREVKIEGGAANITMSPTFVGCPAIDFMQQSIKKAVIDLGYEVVNVKVDMNLVWSTNLLTEKGKQQLKEFGLAPPRQVSETGVSNKDLENVVSQVNVKFEELFKKIAQLEKQMETKNASKKRPKTS